MISRPISMLNLIRRTKRHSNKQLIRNPLSPSPSASEMLFTKNLSIPTTAAQVRPSTHRPRTSNWFRTPSNTAVESSTGSVKTKV